MGCLALIGIVLSAFVLLLTPGPSVGNVFSNVIEVEPVTAGEPSDRALAYNAFPQSRTDDGAFLLGNADAPITIIVFTDPACPFCQDFEPTVERIILEFVASGQAAIEHRTLVTAGGPRTDLAMRYAECAEEAAPGSFWTVRRALFVAAGAGDYDNALSIVSNVSGASTAGLIACAETADQVDIDAALAADLDLLGTPAVAYRIDGTLTALRAGAVPYETISQIIRDAQ